MYTETLPSYNIFMKRLRIIALGCLACISASVFLRPLYATETLIFPDIADLWKFIPLHFAYWDNDFGWFILYYSPIPLPTSQLVQFNNATLSCKAKRDGYYVSFMRGFRVLPLNQEKLDWLKNIPGINNYSNLSLAWWLYTNCEKVWAPTSELLQTKYSTVWALTYNRDGDYGGIYIWWNINTANNTIWNIFNNSLKAIDSNTAQGFLYDSIGWGLSQVSYNYTNTTIVCTTPPCSIDTSWNGSKWIGIEGKVWVSKTLWVNDKVWLQDTIGQNATVYGVDDINASLVIRTISKNTQSLCRWATIYPSLDDYTRLTNTAKAGIKSICLDNTASTLPISINAQVANDLQSKDIIIRNRDVVLSTDFTKSTAPVNLFVDRGNVQIDSNTWILQSFDTQWWIDPINGITKGGYIKGNIFINGLMLGKDNLPVRNKVYIHGKFTSLNLPGTSSAWREAQIQQLFSNLENQEQSILAIYKSFISLPNVFVWACDSLTNSGTVATNNNISCANTGNIYRNKSLIIIDTPYTTNLLFK
jgi:hypothetical protein